MPTADYDKDKRSLQGKTPGKIQRKESLKKLPSTNNTTKTKKSSQMKLLGNDIEYDSDESFSEDKRLYTTVNNEYVIRVNEIMSVPNAFGVNYLFEGYDMTRDVLMLEETLYKQSEKVTKKPSKTAKEKLPSKTEMAAHSIYEMTAMNSNNKLRDDMLVYLFFGSKYQK